MIPRFLSLWSGLVSGLAGRSESAWMPTKHCHYGSSPRPGERLGASPTWERGRPPGPFRAVEEGWDSCSRPRRRRCRKEQPPVRAAVSVDTKWWRRREVNPRPEALRERPLHAQPLLGSRPDTSRRGKTAEGQPRIRFAGASGEPRPLHPHFATSAGARRVRSPSNEAT